MTVAVMKAKMMEEATNPDTRSGLMLRRRPSPIWPAEHDEVADQQHAGREPTSAYAHNAAAGAGPLGRGRPFVVPTLTPAHDAVLAILDWLPVETVADAALVAALLAMPEGDAAWLLDELGEAGCVASAKGPVQ
jgi:hypothetical protein